MMRVVMYYGMREEYSTYRREDAGVLGLAMCGCAIGRVCGYHQMSIQAGEKNVSPIQGFDVALRNVSPKGTT